MDLANKAFKVRLYPTPDQQVQINRTIGCARFVYNHFLARHIEVYKAENRYLKYTESSLILTHLKTTPDTKWLANVDKFALQNSLKNLDKSYKNFFEDRASYPKFKSKRRSNQSYQTNLTNNNIRLDLNLNRIKLPKVGWVEYAADGRIPGDIINVTVSKTPSGKYFASILCGVTIELLPSKPGEVGIDLGLKKFAILSNDEVVENPRYYVKAQHKLARLQRAHAKKKKGSANRKKARLKVARQHEKVANQRRDFQHKLSRKLVNEN